jgi:hypothetical protein
LDRLWAKQQRQARRHRLSLSSRTGMPLGLRLIVIRERKWRGGEWRIYRALGFNVAIPGRHPKCFRIKPGEYRSTWRRAVDLYCKVRGLTDEVKRQVLGYMPKPTNKERI